MNSLLRFSMILILALWVPAAIAGDGVIDIRIPPATGYSIGASGSYRLVSDAAMASGISGITINADHVSLDLNGHSISSSAGSANGIQMSGRKNVSIFNGTIRGFSGIGVAGALVLYSESVVLRDLLIDDCGVNGIQVGAKSSAINCRVRSCKVGIEVGAGSLVESCETLDGGSFGGTVTGIQTGSDSVVRNCRSLDNAGPGAVIGIFVGGGSRVEDCVVQGTVSTGAGAQGIAAGSGGVHLVNCIVKDSTGATSTQGIYLDANSTVERCTSDNNDSSGGNAAGIWGASGMKIRNSTCTGNTSAGGGSSAFGIYALQGAVIEGNTCSFNDASSGNEASGISSTDYATITGNTCVGNDAAGECRGILTGNGCTVSDNTCSDNDSVNSLAIGIRAGSGATIAGNTCIDNTAAGNYEAEGIQVSDGSTVTGNTCRNNDNVGTQAGVGISCGSYCIVLSNTCTDNTEGISDAVSIGIRVVGSRSVIRGNVCSGNSSNGTGTGIGISCLSNNQIEDNTCEANTGVGSGGPFTAAAGIRAYGGCTITGNRCSGNSATGSQSIAAGILSTGYDTITNNTCRGNNAVGAAHGMQTGPSSTVSGNSCTDHAASGGVAMGINAGDDTHLERNICINNDGSAEARGISVGARCRLDGNTCNENDVTTSGYAYGIAAGNDSLITQNECVNNNEGTGNHSSYGINAGNSCVIRDNLCNGNSGFGALGNGFGILSGTGGTLEGNRCNSNSSATIGRGSGIYLGGNSTVEGNSCSANLGSAYPTGGIVTEGSDSIIRSNMTTAQAAGLGLNIAGSGNHSELNRCKENYTVWGGNTSGAGELANLDY